MDVMSPNWTCNATATESIFDAIGETPLIELDVGIDTDVYAKLELVNPTGASKTAFTGG